MSPQPNILQFIRQAYGRFISSF